MDAKPITALLDDWRNGSRQALDELTPIVYRELRKIAAGQLRRERQGHTLQPTALINEAYLRLVGEGNSEWQSRSHFFGVASHLMRQILVQHARMHKAAKRGGGLKVTLNEDVLFSHERPADVIQLDDALQSLVKLDERKARVVELRYFGGLSVEEISNVLEISTATVGREMRFAQAWLARELGVASKSTTAD